MGEEAKVSVTILARNLAKQELESFRQSLRNLGDQARDLLSSQLTQALSLGAILVAVKKAFDATDRYEKSQRTLASTSAITGTSLNELAAISTNLASAYKLSGTEANNYTETITRLTVQAGEFGKTQEAANAFLELGAARGMSVTETMDALENAFIGLYRGAQRVIGQNVNDLFERQARAIGITVGELTEAEKAHILVDAAIKNGQDARGSYAAWLNSSAGIAAQFNSELDKTQVSLGQALAPTRALALEGMAYLARQTANAIALLEGLGIEMAKLSLKEEALEEKEKAWVDEAIANVTDFFQKFGPKGAAIPGDTLQSPMATRLHQWAAQLRASAKTMNQSADEAADEMMTHLAHLLDIAAGRIDVTGGKGGKANPPLGPPETRMVEQYRRQMALLQDQLRDNSKTPAEFAAGMDKIRQAARDLIESRGAKNTIAELGREFKTHTISAQEFGSKLFLLAEHLSSAATGPFVKYRLQLQQLQNQFANTHNVQQFAAGLQHLVTMAVGKKGALDPQVFNQLQEVINGTTDAIDSAAKGLFDFIQLMLDAEVAFNNANAATIDWRKTLGDVANQSFAQLGDVVFQTFEAITDASQKGWQAFQVAGLRAIAAVIRGLAQMLLTYAGGWVAQAIANPAQSAHFLAAAAKATAVALAAMAIAGAISGAANNTAPGGGFAPESSDQTSKENKKGDATIVIEGGFLDMSDPRQADALARALAELTDRQVVIRASR